MRELPEQASFSLMARHGTLLAGLGSQVLALQELDLHESLDERVCSTTTALFAYANFHTCKQPFQVHVGLPTVGITRLMLSFTRQHSNWHCCRILELSEVMKTRPFFQT